MAAKNDITGDSILSKVSSKAFDEGYDRIWGNKKKNADTPSNGEQRLNNVGQLEVYNEGNWNVKTIQ
jgi:hypothetical protein